MTPKRYALGLLALLSSLLVAVGGFNWIVDPFGYFRFVAKPGFNLAKPEFHGYERLVKPALVARMQPGAVILGSSYAEIGLPATHEGFTDGGRLRPYNMAIAGAEWPAVYCYARFVLAQPGTKRVVLGVSGTADASCDSYRNVEKVDYSKLLFSRNAFNASLKTLRNQGGAPSVTPEGMWYFNRFAKEIRNDDDILEKFAIHLRSSVCQQLKPDAPLLTRKIDRSRPATDASTAGLRKLIALARDRDVELFLVDYPQHVLQYELERQCGGAEARWSTLWRIASLVEEEVGPDSKLVTLWDFQAYTQLNSERIRAGIPMPDRLWQDTGHFNSEVGSVVFDTLFRGSDKYGRRVSKGDFDRAISDLEAARETFLKNNGWVQRELGELVARASRKQREAGMAP